MRVFISLRLLLLLICFKTTICSKELDNFLESLKNSAAELDWIGVNLDSSKDSRYSRSSENLEDLLASFSVVNYHSDDNLPESTGQLVGGDAWYSHFRSTECKNGGNCPRRALKVHRHRTGKSKKKKGKSRKFKPKSTDEDIEVKDTSTSSKLHDSDRELDKTEEADDPDYDEYDLQEVPSAKDTKQKKGESGTHVNKNKDYDDELKDQQDQSKNDLSHEADYKLSKIEQDDMDKKARANGTWPLKHPGFELNWMHRRQQPDYFTNDLGGSSPNHWQDKRSLSPTDEIKLMVSNRMMERGLGPSLPSDALGDHKNRFSVADILENSPVPTAMLTRKKRDVNFSEIMENLKENLREQFDEGDLISYFHLPSPPITDNMTLLNHEDFIHSGRKLLQYTEEHDDDSEALSGIKVGANLKGDPFGDTVQLDMDPEILDNINPFKKLIGNTSTINVNAKKNNPQNGAKDISFKFKVSINASILNATGSKCPAKLEDDDVDEFDDGSIVKREAIFSSGSSDLKRATNEVVQDTVRRAADAEQHPLDDLMTGKLSLQVVNAIYKVAKNNKDFHQHIWPSLRSSCSDTQDRLKDVSSGPSYTQDQEKKTETMVREMMQMINTLIEQQIRSRTCIPLRPDLQAFYNQIVEFRNKNADEIGNRKRKTKEQYENWHSVSKRKILSEPKIRRTKSVVKKLLNQFDYLPVDEQERNKDVKDMLQMHLVYLRELEGETDDDNYQNRRKRSIVVRRASQDGVGAESIQAEPREITADFEKLVRTAEVIRKSTLITDDSSDYLSFQSNDYL